MVQQRVCDTAHARTDTPCSSATDDQEVTVTACLDKNRGNGFTGLDLRGDGKPRKFLPDAGRKDPHLLLALADALLHMAPGQQD
jgi:hypothetical protein